MGKIKKHPKVKLIMGFIFQKEPVFKKTKELLEKKFGKIDFESKILSFNHTDYYEDEFGKRLLRKFLSFQRLLNLETLPKIKNYTNLLEKKFSQNYKRQINIDPGYLDLSKLILASTKDYRHRIYLNRGIYAEVTLFYRDKSFKSWEWTYPDYKTVDYIEIFNKIRQLYAKQINA